MQLSQLESHGLLSSSKTYTLASSQQGILELQFQKRIIQFQANPTTEYLIPIAVLTDTGAEVFSLLDVTSELNEMSEVAESFIAVHRNIKAAHVFDCEDVDQKTLRLHNPVQIYKAAEIEDAPG